MKGYCKYEKIEIPSETYCYYCQDCFIEKGFCVCSYWQTSEDDLQKLRKSTEIKDWIWLTKKRLEAIK